MRRWLAIHLPDWSTERVRLWLRGRSSEDANAAILLVETVADRQLVVRACVHGREVGVRRGMTVASARALLGDGPVHVEAYGAEHEAAALERLGRALGRFSPVVVCRPPDGVLLGLDGLERILGPEPRAAEAVLDFLSSLGFGARAAVADVASAALALARHALEPCTVQPARRLRAMVERLPLGALEVEPRIAAALRELELRTVGELLGLSRAQLATRFGPELLAALDRLTGREEERFEPLTYAPPPVCERELEGATTDLEVIALCVRELLDRLEGALSEIDAGALALAVELFPTDAPPSRELVLLSHPSRDPVHLMTLIEPRLERMQLGFGVDRLRVGAPRVGPLRPEQATGYGLGADRGPRLDRALGELLDAYAGRLGRDAGLTVQVVESHVPERAFRPRPVRSGERWRAFRTAPVAVAERPSRLLFEPEPTDVQRDPESGALLALRWRGEERRLVGAFGPERLCGPWWQLPIPPPEATRPPNTTRDYYRVQDASGRWLWVFSWSDRWFVHGEWA